MGGRSLPFFTNVCQGCTFAFDKLDTVVLEGSKETVMSERWWCYSSPRKSLPHCCRR